MRRDREAIRAQISAVTEQLRVNRQQLLELVEELVPQTSEIPEAIVDQRVPPPLEFHFKQLLQAAEREVGTAVEILCRFVGLDEAEMAARWKADRRDAAYSFVEAILRHLSVAHIRVDRFAACAQDGGLLDEDIPETLAALSALGKIAQSIAVLGLGCHNLDEDEDGEEGKHEGEKS